MGEEMEAKELQRMEKLYVKDAMLNGLNRYFPDERLNRMMRSFAEHKLAESMLFGQLTELHYRMFGGTSEQIHQAVAAMELLILSLDIFDDLQDKDNDWVPWSKSDPALAMNAAIGLLPLCFNMIQDSMFPSEAKLRAIAVANRLLCGSVTGQYADIVGDLQDEDACLNMIRRKSGSLAACACLLGTALATESHHETVESLGYCFGMIGQIRNDIDGIRRIDRKNDLLQRKRTLPVIYILEVDDPRADMLRGYYAGEAPQEQLYPYKMDILDLVESSGCVQFAEVHMKLLQHEAAELIEGLPVDTVWKQELSKFA
ncbi:polyprenyl synthetase family protein [Paenibacillus sp. MSJ-34]|uniref:polyprenyl synthetase family protein n=1 Tax=Paenibacillus sp. MSJ-34 TaxID=2841529 RepID=UPI001C10F8AA|nr:polyprenyl synthetase family protein [Paenibacillus sp. MSJ-34]MBU5445528.1 polyprenyl synthetase family protein [Paenibacillus sp. MSJ-34]